MSDPANDERTKAMSETNADTNANVDQLTVEQWLEICKEAGSKIDPETAEVMWKYTETSDPYGVLSTHAGRMVM
jgi:hypothetical protein